MALNASVDSFLPQLEKNVGMKWLNSAESKCNCQSNCACLIIPRVKSSSFQYSEPFTAVTVQAETTAN